MNASAKQLVFGIEQEIVGAYQQENVLCLKTVQLTMVDTALPELFFHGRGRSGEQYFLFTVPVTGEIVPGSSISAPVTAGAAELLPSTAARRLPLRGSWHGASRD